jgi:hypothetical protein
MDKYLVFRLERAIGNHVTGHGMLIEPCFELVKEFDKEVDAVAAAREYNILAKVRTLVIKGSVFG